MVVLWNVVYGVSSAAFVLLNKSILDEYPARLMLLALQQSVVVLGYLAMSKFACTRQLVCSKPPRPILSVEELRKALPVAAAFAVMLSANALCLANSSVGSYFIAKASCLSFNIICSWLFMPSFQVTAGKLLGALLVSASVVIPAPTLQCSTFGFVTGLISALAQAAFMLLSALATPKANSAPPLALMGHYSFLAAGVLWLLALITGGIAVPTAGVMFRILLSGALNLIVAASAVLALAQSDPVAVNVVGYAKSALQLLFATLVFGERLSVKELLSIALILVGGSVYSSSAK